MSKGVKIIAWLAGGLVLALVAVAIAVPLFFDPNDYKQQITRLVKEKTGRDLTIQGEIEMTVFPWLGVQLDKLELSNAKGFGPAPFARIESAHVRAKLMPLLKKQILMDTVTLRGVILHLSKDKAGRSNWADLAAPEQGESALPQLGAIAVGGLEVDDSTLVWDDQSKGTHYTLNKITLRSDALAPHKDFDITLGFDMHNRESALSSRIEARSTGNIDLDKERYLFKDTHLTAQLSGPDLPANTKLQLSTDISADLQQQTLSLADLKAQGPELTISGSLRADKILSAPAYSGPLSVSEFNPRALLKQWGITVPHTADPAVLNKATARFQVAGTREQLTLNELIVQLDDSTAKGSFTIKDFATAALGFDLSLDTIDVDRYLPPKPAEAEAAQQAQAGPLLRIAEQRVQGAAVPVATPPAGSVAANPWPVETLRKLNLTGTLRIAALKVANISTNGVVINVAAKNGVLKFNPFNAQLYGGKYSGNIGLDARGNAPRLTLDDTLNGVAAGPLLKDLLGKESVTGKATVSAKLSAQALPSGDMMQTLNGQMLFLFVDGALKGVNVAKLIRDAQARLKGQPPPDSKEPNQTDFSELRGTGVLKNGVLRNDDLSAKSPLLRLTGKGDINLPSKQMDYLLNITLVKTLKGQGGKELDELSGVTIPVMVSGPFADLSYQPDIDALFSNRAKARVEEKKQEIQQRIDEKLQEKLQDLFP